MNLLAIPENVRDGRDFAIRVDVQIPRLLVSSGGEVVFVDTIRDAQFFQENGCFVPIRSLGRIENDLWRI
jgi:hypothetical protein